METGVIYNRPKQALMTLYTDSVTAEQKHNGKGRCLSQKMVNFLRILLTINVIIKQWWSYSASKTDTKNKLICLCILSMIETLSWR
jgi:hypothetical protein